MIKPLSLLALTLIVNFGAKAEIVTAEADHYALRQEAFSTLDADALWQRLTDPASWWHPDHTYSGDAANLSLDLKAGGLWQEKWDSGAVEHGRILQIQNGTMLRLDAPFGPLQDIAVQVVWTITLTPGEKGTKVTFIETANGTSASKLDELAPAVDYVKTEAIKRLTQSGQ